MEDKQICKMFAVIVVILFLGTCIIPVMAQEVKKTSPPSSKGSWLYVGGSGPNNYTRIQDAIDNASDGDTVFVYNGTYHEGIEIDKMLYLIGENKYKTIINSTSINDVSIYLSDTSDGTMVEGFTIQNLEYEPKIISVLIASDNTIINENIIINREGIGGIICEEGCTGNTISNNTLDTRRSGIRLISSNNNYLIGNIISGTSNSPIALTGSSHNSIINNVVTSDNTYGIYLLEFSHENIVAGNFINSQKTGISLSTSDKNIISENIIIGTEDRALGFTFSHLNKVFRNSINVTDRFGISIGYSICNKIYENNFFNGPMTWQIDFYQYLWFPLRNRWHNNYWGRPRTFPKVIEGWLYFGAIGMLPLTMPWPQFDFFPAQEPYDI